MFLKNVFTKCVYIFSQRLRLCHLLLFVRVAVGLAFFLPNILFNFLNISNIFEKCVHEQHPRENEQNISTKR